MWKVLIVDDDPDMAAVTELALKALTVLDQRLQCIKADSAARARQTLAENPDTAVALIDVIMETEDAGLVLCYDIRRTLNNPFLQIYLRTGHVEGPPKQVLEDCGCAGFVYKPESTAEKLRDVVAAGIERYVAARRATRE